MENKNQITNGGVENIEGVPAPIDADGGVGIVGIQAGSLQDDVTSLGANEPVVAINPLRENLRTRLLRRADILLVGLLIAGGFALIATTTMSRNRNKPAVTAAKQYATVQIPLSGFLATENGINVGSSSVVINGSLKLNQGLVISPSVQPNAPVSGQLYFDQNTNQLAYYNGAAFVPLTATGKVVQTIGGASGNLTLGGGLSIVGNQLISSSNGVTSFGGLTGAIAVGSGLTMSGNTLQNGGVLSLTAGTPNLVINNDGNGNLTISNVGGGSGTVTSGGGTAGKLPVFTTSQNIEDSIVSQSGGVITVTGNATVTGTLSLGAALHVTDGGTGANSLTANGVIIGNGVSPLTSVAAGSAGLCLMSTAGAPAWGACPGGAAVTSLDGLTGALTIANSSGSGATITINDANTAGTKGLATFNATNFTAASGTVNTVQDINATADPTFRNLTLSTLSVNSGQAAANMLFVNNTNAAAAGNLLDLQLNGSSKFSVQPNGSISVVGTINGQTISNAASFTGTMGVTGLASLNGGATVTGTLTANIITPTAAMTIGSTGQTLTIQGGAATTLVANNGANATTISFQSPTANVTYRFLTTTAGTYDICTTAGNCVGAGGGVITPGGTTNAIAKFTGSQTLGNSSITDNGSTVSTSGTLVVQGSSATIGVANAQTGNLVLADGGSTFSGTLTQGTLTAARTYTLPDATGTVCLSSGNCLGGGGGGANTSLSNLSSVAINTTLLPGSAAGIDLGSSTLPFKEMYLAGTSGTPGTNNFKVTGASTGGTRTITLPDATGTVCLQTASACGFATGSGAAFVQGGNSFGATGTLGTNDNNGLNIRTNGSTALALAANGAATFSGAVTINGPSLSSGGAFSITPGGALTVGATGQAFTLQGSASSVITATGNSHLTTVGFTGTATADVVYNFDRTATAGTYTICTTAGNCSGVGGGVTTPGGTTNTIPKFTAAQTIGNSSITDDGTTVSIGEDLSVAANKNFSLSSGTGTISQTYSNTSGTAHTLAVTDSAGSGTTTVQGFSINLTGTNNASGSNALTGINFGNVTAATNNSFYAINFGTGFTDLLRYNSSQLISGAGILQNAAVGSSVNYSNLTQVGALTGGSIAAGFSTIATSNTITGTTLNGTIGINTGVGAGTQRIDSSGNLVNIGNITPSGSMTIGSTSQQFTLQGSATSTITSTGNSHVTTVGFTGTATADVIYNFDRTAGAGTYIICTSAGNCLGGGSGGANTSLSNLTSVAINTSLLSGSSTIDLGSNANPFRDLYLGGTATNNFQLTGTATAARTITLDDLSGRLALVQTAGSSSAQTGDINVSGTLIAGTALQGTLVKSADGAGSSSAITLRSGNTTGGSGLSTGGITIKSGDGSGTNTSSGNVTIDAGTTTGSGTAGTIGIGTANTSALTLGRGGVTTTNGGALTVGQLLTANGGASVAANQNLTLQSGSGVFSQIYSNGSAGSAQTLSVTNANSGASSVAVNGQDITLVGTATSGGTNTNAAIKFENPSAAANNVFYGLNFAGTGYTDVLRVNGSQIISGAGKLQNGGIDSSVNYSNLTQVGTLTSGALGAGFTTVAVGQGGTGAISFTSNGVLYGNNTGAIQATVAGTTGQCLVANTGAAPTWTTCTGLVTLQNAYNNGNTISTGSNDIAFTLNSSQNFTVATAAGATGSTIFSLTNGSNATPPSQLVLVKNDDVNEVLGTAISVQSAAGGITTAFDASGLNITNALAIGVHAITGTNFSVTGGGAVTAVGVDAGTGLLQGTGGFTVTGATSINNNANSNTNINTGSSTGTVAIGGGSTPLVIDSTNFDVSSAGALSGITGYAQASGNFLQSGSGTFGTGTGSVSLNGGTTIAATKTLTVTSGLTSLTSDTTGDALNVSNSTSTGNIAVFKDNTTAVLTLANGGGATFANETNSSSAFVVQNATAADTLFKIDTSARSASGGNLVKIGNSTGTDTNMTILQLDAATTDPTTNLSALNGGLFYNSTTNKVSLIESGQVKIICNTTDLGCGTGTVTLQNAYNNGNTISTGSNDIAFTLNSSQNFTVATAAGGTGFTTFSLADGSNATPPSQLVLVKNNDTNQALSTGISVQSAAGGITTAFDASGSNITNALAIGAHAITGTNFSVTGGGAVTAVGVNSGTGLLQGTGGLTVTGTVQMNASGSSVTTIGSGSAGAVSIASGAASNFTVTGSTLALSGTNFSLNTSGVLSLAGGQTSDVTTPGAGSATALTMKPGDSSASNGTGAATTVRAGDATSTTCGTACAGGALTLQGGSATGASGATRNGGAVSIDGGTGATANGAVNIGTNADSAIVIGKTNGTSTITLGQSTASETVNIGNATVAAGNTETINVGTASTGTGKTAITIGSTNDGSSILVQGGTGNVQIQSQGGTLGIGNNAVAQTLQIGNTTGATAVTIDSGTGTIAIGTGAQARTVNIANGAAVQAVTLGSTNSTSSTTIQGGNSSSAVSIQAASSGTISIGTSNDTVITLGNTSATNTLTLGQSTASNTINIGNGTVAAGNTETINIGTSATSTGKTSITMGSTNDGSAVTIQAGTGGLSITTQGTGTLGVGNNAVAQTLAIGNGTGGTSVAVSCGTGTCGFGNNATDHSTTVGSATGTSLTTIQGGTGNINLSTTGNVTIGTSDTTGTLLVLDTKTGWTAGQTSDPTGVAGGMYYNSGNGSFRCYEVDHWADCLESARSGYHHIFELTAGGNISGGGEIYADNFATGASINGTPGVTGHPGLAEISTGTDASAFAYIGSAADNDILLGNTDYWRYEADLRIPSASSALSTSSQRYTIRSGFMEQSTNSDGVDGCFFKYNDVTGANNPNGKWMGICLSNSSSTTCDTTIAVALDTWYRLTVVVNAAGTSADFRINGVSECTVASNIPTGAGRQTGRGTSMQKSVGITARDMDLDYEEIEGQFGTAR